jgi:Membrane bound FAD containing D-sorbitol dehydrogenase
MDGSNAPLGEDVGFDPRRRALLTSMAAASLFPAIAPARAQTTDAQDAFLAVSTYLTGRPSLDPDHAALLLEALAADTPQFETDLRRLRAWIEEHETGAHELQRALDAEASALASLPRKIVTAWYTGVVGEGARARCVTFETSLMHQVVADWLNRRVTATGRTEAGRSPPSREDRCPTGLQPTWS